MRVASSPDNDGTGQYCQMAWVRQARRKGVREKPASERSSRANTSSNLADVGWVATRPRRDRGELLGSVNVVGREAMPKVCGVGMARSQGHSWAPHLSNGSE